MAWIQSCAEEIPPPFSCQFLDFIFLVKADNVFIVTYQLLHDEGALPLGKEQGAFFYPGLKAFDLQFVAK